MNYKIGLDLGITSVGWAVVELDKNDEPFRIINIGSRIFEKAEVPKTGASLALPRREARSARRRLRRHRHRLERIKNLLIKASVITPNELAVLYNSKNLKDIYELRVCALERKLSQDEFARLLIHLAQRRGFKSNRKADKADESGKLLKATQENESIIKEKGYRTVGEMFCKDEKFQGCKRNKSENYSNTVLRSQVLEEIKLIFQKQRKLGFEFAGEEIENNYIDIWSSQRAFDEGPGGDSPYGGNQIEKMIGKCTLEPEEPRAPKASYSFEHFALLAKINAIKILRTGEGERFLTKTEREKIAELAHKSDSVTYKKIRKELGFQNDEIFNISYGYNDKDEVEEKTKLNYLKSFHEMRKAFDKFEKGRFKIISKNERNIIAYAFTVYKNDQKIKEYLRENGLKEEYIYVLVENLQGFTKVGNLSIKACDKIIPFLEEGCLYNEACEKAGYNFKGHAEEKQTFLKPLPHDQYEITNPVVKRSISQAIKVINACIRLYGSPAFIGLELAREMSKNFSDRKKIEKEQSDNATKNDNIIKKLKDEFGVTNPTGIDIVKLKLWEEQGGICPYSQKSLEIERIFEKGYCDIDHIIPYSISFDDGYRNKVLVLAEENRQKGNRLPLEYLQGKRREDYIVYVKSSVRNNAKQSRLLKTAITDEDRETFRERNLSDTQFLARFMYNYINDSLLFAANNSGKKKVVTPVNGMLTSFMRKRWGISKIREDGDLHHAVDALVVACITPGMIQRASKYSKFKETQYEEHVDSVTGMVFDINKKTGELAKGFPLPFENFREQISEKLEEAFVSRMPRHKVTGAAHKDTIRSARLLEKGQTVSKVPLTSLKLDKNGEIEGYYNPESDRLLYEALKKRLITFNKNAKEAFVEPFYKPMSNGQNGHIVKKVKIVDKSSLSVTVHDGRGVADNDSMVRVDIFKIEKDPKNNGYYAVPIYVADTVKKELPNRAVVAHKSYEDWKEMKEEDFLFSLYPRDLIKIKHKTGLELTRIADENSRSKLPKKIKNNEFFLYYVKMGISTGTITVINHDETYTIPSLGLKTLLSIEKYQVDILGNVSKVTIPEKRMRFFEKSKDQGLH